jgi:outer membrane biosynthesis protein TonB
MSGKKQTSTSSNLQTLKIGSRVRCTDDGVEGRITWANATAVKIEWADGEKVTWKRGDLASKGIEVLGDAPDEPAVEQAQAEPTPEPAPVEQASEPALVEQPMPEPSPESQPIDQTQPMTTEQTPTEQTAPVEQVTTEQAAGNEAPQAKKPRTRKANANDSKERKLSALDAAARVLGEAGQPMTCPEMIEAMATKGYWMSPGGQTPAATLYSAILREVTTKGADARFVKTERGKFARKNEV